MKRTPANHLGQGNPLSCTVLTALPLFLPASVDARADDIDADYIVDEKQSPTLTPTVEAPVSENLSIRRLPLQHRINGHPGTRHCWRCRSVVRGGGQVIVLMSLRSPSDVRRRYNEGSASGDRGQGRQ